MQEWQEKLEEYIKLGEPSQSEKSKAWQIGIGLQQVDGLQTSDYLLATAQEHIEGYITIGDVQQRLLTYYDAKEGRSSLEDRTKEADLVAARIAELLGEKAFQFSYLGWKNIHKRLFNGIFDHAGQLRTYNVVKKEWVLNGESVIYAAHDSIVELLDFDFATEKSFSYAGLGVDKAIRHLAKFAADIWQIHPFCEGNTRATAVFMLKYMQSFGFKVQNTAFKEHSWYFRNALVRANYNDIQNDVYATTVYLELFFRNMLLGENNPLKNRFLHLNYQDKKSQAVLNTAEKESICTLNCSLDCTLEELSLLQIIAEEPAITQKELAARLGKSIRTVQNKINGLKERGILQRHGGKCRGYWKIERV